MHASDKAKMEYNSLGNTGIVVSKLCFGSLTIGPLQRGLPINDGFKVIEKAIDHGINFIDTADLYGTYPYIKLAVKKKKDLVVATKSYAYDTQTAKKTLERALYGIGREYIDIFLLHEQESIHTLRGHAEALSFFLDQKKKGIIRAVGISTHYYQAVEAAAKMDEIDVIHPILNYKGYGIVDGTRADMENAVMEAYKRGKGIYVMKPLGGGHLIQDYKNAFDFVLDFPYIHSIAVGMQRIEEVDFNVNYLLNRQISNDLLGSINKYKRELIIQDWCQKCGNCIVKCPQNALSFGDDGKLKVDHNKCIFCGYCGSECKELAIKVI